MAQEAECAALSCCWPTDTGSQAVDVIASQNAEPASQAEKAADRQEGKQTGKQACQATNTSTHLTVLPVLSNMLLLMTTMKHAQSHETPVEKSAQQE